MNNLVHLPMGQIWHLQDLTVISAVANLAEVEPELKDVGR